MCGILVHKGTGDNSRIRLRGQDATVEARINGFTFVHNLLNVTGEITFQPFIDKGIVCLYNGEIYNHEYERSDGENLIPLYRKHGATFARHLDGEFAIALYDFEKRKIIFAKDPFGTKPLFVRGDECASYRSGLEMSEKLPHNTIRIVGMERKDFEDIPVVRWDLTQHKTHYDDWIRAFEEAVKKRATDGCFIGLSSGYDSGAIACAMLNAGVTFKAYTYKGKEDQKILEERKKLVETGYNESEEFEPDKNLLPFLKENMDDEEMPIRYKSGQKFTLLTEGGTLGVATIAERAKREGRKVCLSGQGSDEILSDYATYPDQSELNGKFPETQKLWYNFDRGCQEAYLTKEEYAGGTFNVETRYPFLDKDLVQEFLWLTPELKNRAYKAPLKEYLTKNKFPFKEGEKIGFSVEL